MHTVYLACGEQEPYTRAYAYACMIIYTCTYTCVVTRVYAYYIPCLWRARAGGLPRPAPTTVPIYVLIYRSMCVCVYFVFACAYVCKFLRVCVYVYRQTDRQTHRHTDRRTHTHAHTLTHSHTHTHTQRPHTLTRHAVSTSRSRSASLSRALASACLTKQRHCVYGCMFKHIVSMCVCVYV